MAKSYIINALRTSIVPVGGCLRNHSVDQMASHLIKESIRQSDLTTDALDDLILSNALGGGGNIARLSLLNAGLASTILGTSLDRQCVGGLDAVVQAMQRIQQGTADCLLAGGAESYSLRPKRYYRASWQDEFNFFDRPPFFPGDLPENSIGNSVIELKKEFAVSDEEEFEWSRNSHQKTRQHLKATEKEILPLTKDHQSDPFARNLSWEIFQKAKAKYGALHSANTAPTADGASILTVASENFIRQNTPKKYLEIIDGFTLGGNPKEFPLIPVEAVEKLFSVHQLSWQDITQFELMEAYTVQALLTARLTHAPHEIINPYGGAIARGHPIGASGAILATRLYHGLTKEGELGIAAIAGAGGYATVLLVKNRLTTEL